MNDEFHDIENRLAALRPGSPDAALLERLEAAAHGMLPLLTPEEARFEARLGSHVPAALPPGFMASLEKVVAATPFHVDEKIVMFTKANSAAPAARRYRPWAAAAAVAVLGGITALMMPGGGRGAGGPLVHNLPSAGSSGTKNGVVTTGYGHNLQEAKDEGIVWKDEKPYRVVRVVYKDLVRYTDAQGKQVEVEQPRVELTLVPAKID